MTECLSSIMVFSEKVLLNFVKIYGGEPVLYTVDYHEPVQAAALAAYLEKDHEYKYATVVHCDTPSGVLNDLESICPLLKKYGIFNSSGLCGSYVWPGG